VRSKRCPYGVALPMSVTWPVPPRELRGVVSPCSFMKMLAVAWSLSPFVVFLWVAVDLLVVRRSRQNLERHMPVLAFLAISLLLTELVLKKVLSEPRPGNLLQVTDYAGRFAGSCLDTCGMPSSHSALACGWFLLMLFDAVPRAHPVRVQFDESLTERLGAGEDFVLSGSQRRRLPEMERNGRRRRGELRALLLAPWAQWETLTQRELLAVVLAWGFLMLPVPFMRVVLYDHSLSQVASGCALGALVSSLVWLGLRRYCTERRPSFQVRNVQGSEAGRACDALPPRRPDGAGGAAAERRAGSNTPPAGDAQRAGGARGAVAETLGV